MLILKDSIKTHNATNAINQLCFYDLLVEVSFRNGEEAAVSLGSHSKSEGLAGQDCKLTDELPGVRHKQTCVFFTVNHPLVDM